MTEFTTMSLVCFICALKHGVAVLFMPARLWALPEGSRLFSNEGVFVPHLSEMRANALRRELSRLTNNCAADPMAATLAFARLGKTDCVVPDCVGWYLYDITDVAIIFVPEWQIKSSKRRLRGEALPGVVHAKASLPYVEKFRDASMSREFAKAV